MKWSSMALAGMVAFTGAATAAGPKPGAAVQLEPIPGSALKRITLTARAAERLGIATGLVSEEQIARTLMVSGVVTMAPPAADPRMAAGAGARFAGFAQLASQPAPLPPVKTLPPAGAPVLVAVALSPGEWARVDKEKPARLRPLFTRDAPAQSLVAQPSSMEPAVDPRRSMLTVHYTLASADPGIVEARRLRVELPLAGAAEKQRVVPYGAVYYDAKGAPWVYVATQPLVFERRSITVERVVGELALLSEGPPLGTPVVTVGAALLYGTELFGK